MTHSQFEKVSVHPVNIFRIQEILDRKFIEHNLVHGNYYGTSLDQVLFIRDTEKKVCILDIDVKGAKDIHSSKLIECNYLFVKTPSLKNLEERLIARKTETPETL